MGLYEWGRRKARRNEWKNGVTFPEAETVFLDPQLLEMSDETHSTYEPRTATIGWSAIGRLLVVITSEGGQRPPRTISACAPLSANKMHTYDDNSDVNRVELDFSRATRATGPRFPEGFEIRIEGATGYSLRLIPSNKIIGRFTTTREAWPAVVAAIERGIPARCLVLDAHFADGDRDNVGSGRILEATARAGIGISAARRPARAAS